jgi:signal transduction histidine kinase
VTLDLRLQSDLPKVFVDQGQVEQIILHLALNAREAMPEGGRLTVETALRQLSGSEIHQLYPGLDLPAGSYVRLSISDTGVGMGPETLERIFEPFFTTKPIGKGTGMGLASVYGAVKQNQGYIWVSSSIGQGTRFEIYLPVSSEK